MVGLILGLVAAAGYGAADFCGGLAAKRAPMVAVACGGQATGLLVLVPLALAAPAHPTMRDIVFGLTAGVCGGVGIALLYHALAIGKMGVVSPITAVLAAAVPVAAGFARGERLHAAQIVGIAVALMAIVLISLTTEESGEREIATAGVREAIASGVLLGGFLAILAFVRAEAGFDGLLAARCSSVFVLAAIAFVARVDPRPPRATFALVGGSGLLDGTALVLYVFAARFGGLSIAAVLTSLYPAATVLLARVVLRERLRVWQFAGMALALAGVALIALGR